MLSVENYKKVLPLPLSEEADTGSGGDQPARNILTECNGKGERKFPNPFFLLQSLMPKKTHCFDRNKRKKKQVLIRKRVNLFQDKTTACRAISADFDLAKLDSFVLRLTV